METSQKIKVDTIVIIKCKAYEYVCPYCKTKVIDHLLTKSIIKILCSHCNNPIEFDWD